MSIKSKAGRPAIVVALLWLNNAVMFSPTEKALGHFEVYNKPSSLYPCVNF